jgi:hypothetical protein
MEKAMAGRLAWYQLSGNRPRTKDDDEDEEDSDMTLQRY